MKALVYVTLKPGVLDPQGKAIEHALSSLGFSVEEMCRKLLANTVIEDFSVEIQS